MSGGERRGGVGREKEGRGMKKGGGDSVVRGEKGEEREEEDNGET